MKVGDVFIYEGMSFQVEEVVPNIGAAGHISFVACSGPGEEDGPWAKGYDERSKEVPAILKRDFGRQEVLIAAHATRPFTVALCGGKYRLTNTCGKLTCLRGGEAWPAGDEALSGDSLSLAMVQRIQEMEERMELILTLIRHDSLGEAKRVLQSKEWES